MDEIESWERYDWREEIEELRTQLAACQAHNSELREAIKWQVLATCHAAHDDASQANEYQVVLAKEALSHTTDTEALNAAIAKAQGRADKLCITAKCYCKLDDETDEVVRLCAAHKEFMDVTIAKAVEVEREACAMIAKESGLTHPVKIATAIRARGKP